MSRSLSLLLPLCGVVTITPVLVLSTACNCAPEQEGVVTPAPVPAAPTEPEGSDGPMIEGNPHAHQTRDRAAGQRVFRMETFGNEGFWTEAMRLPAGMQAARFTPMDALEAGLQIDSDAVDPAMLTAMGLELATDRSPESAPMLHDPAVAVALVNANAVIGIVAVDTSGDGTIDITAGDRVGIACALCHTITDESQFAMPNGGSIGRRIDGPANLHLDMGSLLALAANSRAYYPNLQAELGGATHGRAPTGLTEHSTEAEVDAYLTNRAFYPVGTFDETSDGVGNPVKNTPLLRTDLAAPWATAGEHALLDDIGNGSYTVNLDMSTLATPEGRQFLAMNGGAAGEELGADYAMILTETGVTGFPFVRARMTGTIDPHSPVGRRVDDGTLFDMSAYLDALAAPEGAEIDAATRDRALAVFRVQCTSCHSVDQSRMVLPQIIEMTTIFPGYAPVVIAERPAPRTPIQDSPGTFDDKMVVVDASDRGLHRGVAVPLLIDLARTTLFLHDASLHSLDELLDPSRGPTAPHPFYVEDQARRADVVALLRSFDIDR